MSKNDSFFERLGRSLKIEDTDYDVSLTYAESEDDSDSDDLLDDETREAIENLENMPQPDSTNDDDLEVDEDMLKELSEEMDENTETGGDNVIATLAASPAKTKQTTPTKKIPKNSNAVSGLRKAASRNKQTTTMPKIKSKTKDSFDDGLEEGRLNIDVYELNDEIVIKSAIAGINENDLDIDITPDSVTIRGQRNREEEIAEENYFYKECYWGVFSRSVRLHTEIDPDKSEATLNNGILTVRLPKLSKSNQKKLRVRKIS